LGREVLRGSVEAPYTLLDDAGTAVAGLLREEAGITGRYRARPAPTRNPEAFDLYLEARSLAVGDEAGGLESALALTNRALEGDAGFAPAWILKGEIHLARWRADRREAFLSEAEEACRQAVETDPARAGAHLCAARVLAAQDRLLEAEEEFVRTLELDATPIEAYEELGEVFQGLGNPDRGELTWKRIIDLHPNFWGGYWALGYFYYNSERYEAAIEQYRRALDLAPDNAMVYLGLGAARFVLGRLEEAVLAYEKSLQVRPNYRAYTNLGTVYLLFRRFREAVSSYERAIEFPEANFAAYGSLGTAYFWSPDYDEDEVSEAFRKAAALCREELERAPNDSAAWIWLAFDLAMLDRREESLAALDKALSLNPDDPHYFYFAARIHDILGERDEVLDWLERAVKGGYPRTEIRLSVEFDDLRGESRFQKLLEGG
jgi:tetratricopeptide (TPR) repeat protein